MSEPVISTGPIACLITGMHRSGTSLASYMLHAMGADLGNTLMPAQPDNPTGFWENMQIMRINNRILGSLGASWDWIDPHEATLDTQHLQSDLDALARHVVASEFNPSAEFIAIKDPRLCLLGSLWSNALRALNFETKSIVTFRHPQDVAQSLQRRNGFTQRHAEALWIQYAIAWLHSEDDSLLLDYANNIASPGRYDAITKFTGRVNHPGQLGVIETFIDLNLNHGSSAHPPSPIGDFYTQCIAPLSNSIINRDKKQRILQELLPLHQAIEPYWGGSMLNRLTHGELQIPPNNPGFLLPPGNEPTAGLVLRRQVTALALEINRTPKPLVARNLADALKALAETNIELATAQTKIARLQNGQAELRAQAEQTTSELVQLVANMAGTMRWRTADAVLKLVNRIQGKPNPTAITERAQAIAALGQRNEDLQGCIARGGSPLSSKVR